MELQTRFISRNVMFTVAVLLAALLLAAAAPQAVTTAAVVTTLEVSAPEATAPQVLNYQGRLADASGNALSGTYQMFFALYDAEIGGNLKWSESRAVTVTGGLFSIRLGESTHFPTPTIFDGQALWLDLTVQGQMTTPRMLVSYVAYAMYANRAGAAGSASTAELAANADRLGGQLPASYAATGHTHDAGAITSGTLSTDRFSAYADLVADNRVGEASSQVAAGNHLHDSRYYTESESDIRFVKKAGDTMSSALTVPLVVYSPARTQVASVIGEHFVSRDNQPFSNGGGMGGANQLNTSTGCLVAALQLPNGAVVTQFKGFFYDKSSSDLKIYLIRLSMTGGAYSFMAEVTSSGAPEYGSMTDTSISAATVDNTTNGYNVMACATPAWDGTHNLRVMGASITYTISEAH